MGDAAPQAKKARMDLPTKDEQKNLLEVESLMRNNLLHLQVAEILNQVNAEKRFQKKSLVEWLDNLVSDLGAASLGSKKSEISGRWLSTQGLPGVTLVENDVKISFDKPTSVDYIGSFASQTATVPLLNIDVAVMMPSDMFDKR
jgi:hypothetical protein